MVFVVQYWKLVCRCLGGCARDMCLRTDTAAVVLTAVERRYKQTAMQKKAYHEDGIKIPDCVMAKIPKQVVFDKSLPWAKTHPASFGVKSLFHSFVKTLIELNTGERLKMNFTHGNGFGLKNRLGVAVRGARLQSVCV